jgi:hypothetical protein
VDGNGHPAEAAFAYPGEPPPDGPTLIFALEEPLGVRARPQRAAVPMLVVESGELPTRV